MPSTQLSVLLRPKRLDDVLGQPGAVAYVRGMIERRAAPNLLLLAGPSGTGKTSLGRIIGSRLTGWRDDPDRDPDIREVPATVERSIDEVRELIQFGRYAPRGNRRRVILVDEAHGYVGPAASALLKATEEPPPHLTWIFATDQPEKLNRTLVSRAQVIRLQAIDDDPLAEIVRRTLRHERVRLNERARAAIERDVARCAHGSARVAVQMIETLATCLAGGGSAREALDMALAGGGGAQGVDAALAFVQAALAGDARAAVTALAATDGQGVPEVAIPMVSGLLRRACGVNPRDGLGWLATKRIRGTPDVARLRALLRQLCIVQHTRINSQYAVPADALLMCVVDAETKS